MYFVSIYFFFLLSFLPLGSNASRVYSHFRFILVLPPFSVSYFESIYKIFWSIISFHYNFRGIPNFFFFFFDSVSSLVLVCTGNFCTSQNAPILLLNRSSTKASTNAISHIHEATSRIVANWLPDCKIRMKKENDRANRSIATNETEKQVRTRQRRGVSREIVNCVHNNHWCIQLLLFHSYSSCTCVYLLKSFVTAEVQLFTCSLFYYMH